MIASDSFLKIENKNIFLLFNIEAKSELRWFKQGHNLN